MVYCTQVKFLSNNKMTINPHSLLMPPWCEYSFPLPVLWMGIGLEGCSREEIVFTNIQGRDCMHIHFVKIFFSQKFKDSEAIVFKYTQGRDSIENYLGKRLYYQIFREGIVFTIIQKSYCIHKYLGKIFNLQLSRKWIEVIKYFGISREDIVF